jgi:hypothetical protein
MHNISIWQVLRNFHGIESSRWAFLTVVAALWVVAQVLGRTLAAGDQVGPEVADWWPLAQAAIAAAALAIVTIIALRVAASGGYAPGWMVRLIAGAPILFAGGVVVEWIVPALYGLAAQGPIAPGLLTLAALAAPTVMLAFFGPALAAAMHGPHWPWSAIREGLAVTRGLRWKLGLLVGCWLIISLCVSTLLRLTPNDVYRSFFLAVGDLFALPLAIFLARLYIERTGQDGGADQVTAVFD